MVSSQVSALFHIASSKEPPVIPEVLSKEGRDFLLLCFNRCSSLCCNPIDPLNNLQHAAILVPFITSLGIFHLCHQTLQPMNGATSCYLEHILHVSVSAGAGRPRSGRARRGCCVTRGWLTWRARAPQPPSPTSLSTLTCPGCATPDKSALP